MAKADAVLTVVDSDAIAMSVGEGFSAVDGSVGTAKLTDKAVTSEKLADGAVTVDKVAAGAITSDKLAGMTVVTDEQIRRLFT